MEYRLINELIDKKLSTREISEALGKSQSTVKYWLQKYDLKTYYATKETQTKEERRISGIAAVHKRRKLLKIKGVEYKGGKCEVCGYDKCVEAMDFHHINPEEKEFGISMSGTTKSWDKIKIELDKCKLLCANCHREYHANKITL